MSRRQKATEGAHRAQVILQVCSGQLSVADAAAQLGLSEQRIYQLRDKARAAVEAACEPGQPGRPPTEPPHPDTVRATELQQQVAEAKAELEAERLRQEIGLFLPRVLTDPPPPPPAKKKGRRGKGGRRG